MYKKIQWVIAGSLLFISPALYALGLGGAVVDSYLDQPLEVRVEVIAQSSEELQSVTVGLASVDDFAMLGLSRSAITVPLEFELVADASRPYIRITSDLAVSEPIIQVLVEVNWASGRMLREYTLFLDPPTFPAQAPQPKVASEPQPAPTPAPPPPTQPERTQVTPPAPAAPPRVSAP